MKRFIEILMLFACFLVMIGCNSLADSPFKNDENNGFDDVEILIDQTRDLISGYTDKIPEYDDIKDGSPGCMTQIYDRDDQSNYILSSNKYFYETNEQYLQFERVSRALMTGLGFLRDENNEKALKEGVEYSLEPLFQGSFFYYIEGYRLYYHQTILDGDVQTKISINVDLTPNEESVILYEEDFLNEERNNLAIIDLNLNLLTEKSIFITEYYVKLIELKEDNSLFFLIKYDDDQYSEILYYDAIENEHYRYNENNPNSLEYVKYEGDHIKYSMNLNDLSSIRYNLQEVSGWDVIRPVEGECDVVDLLLGDMTVLGHQTLETRSFDQYFLIVDFETQNPDDTLLSLAHISLSSDLNMNFIQSKQDFSFDAFLLEMNLTFNVEDLEERLIEGYDIPSTE